MDIKQDDMNLSFLLLDKKVNETQKSLHVFFLFDRLLPECSDTQSQTELINHPSI